MNIEAIDTRPNPTLASALEKFESQFRYPLGSDAWFRISHCDDYTCFFRAIGDACSFVAMRDGDVIGVISAMVCNVRQPGQGFQRTGYISDLKVSRAVGGRTLFRLLRAATDWVLTEPTPGFCVVMDGTSKDPASYTGRLGIPAFEELCQLMILRIPCNTSRDHASVECPSRTIDEAKSLYQQLTAQHYATAAGDMTLRSQMTPIGLSTVDGRACGILEDTRRGKRLFDSHGREMVSAHLSCFGYADPFAASTLIAGAVDRCRDSSLPALFVAIPRSDADEIVRRMAIADIVEAPARVFGYDFGVQGTWSINTAEI